MNALHFRADTDNTIEEITKILNTYSDVECVFIKKSGWDYSFYANENFDLRTFMNNENILDAGLTYPAKVLSIEDQILFNTVGLNGRSGVSCHSDIGADYKEKPFVHNIREERTEKLIKIEK